MRNVWVAMALALVAPAGHAGDDDDGPLARGLEITREFRLVEGLKDGEAICREHAQGQDVAALVAQMPELLGGIQPDDPEWELARALYLDAVAAGCQYDIGAIERAYALELGRALSEDDTAQVLAFYRSDVGTRLLDASMLANIASHRATRPLPGAENAYTEFLDRMKAIVAQRPNAPATQAPGPAVPVARPVPAMNDVVALSDRAMQRIAAGDVHDAFALLRPHAVLPGDRIDHLAGQFEQQAPIRAERYGRSVDYDLLRNDSIGDALISTVFLHRHERYAVVWQFGWYRGEDGWYLTHVRYSDELVQMFR